jgi:hypothetical protein
MGIASSCLLICLFILHTGNQYKILTGHWQFSPFGGWQIANNAIYAYRFVDSADRKPVPPIYADLDNIIRKHFDSTRDFKKFPFEKVMAGTYYMWSPGLPLYKYKDIKFPKDSNEFRSWASIAPFFCKYGLQIIKRYPFQYVLYFLWPNANKYYAPPVEFLGIYNSNKDTVATIAKIWFHYKSKKIATRMSSAKIDILNFYPFLSGTINAVMLVNLICFLMLKRFHKDTLFRKGILLVGIIWITNACFTILASSPALRFQSFPILLTVIFSLLLVDWLIKLMNVKSMKNTTDIQMGNTEFNSLPYVE